MRKKKIERTRTEVMVDTLTTLSDWRVKCETLNTQARWKELHDFREALRHEHLDRLYQDVTKDLDLSDLLVIKGTIEKWFPEESRGVGWFRHILTDAIERSYQKERGKR